MKKLLLILPIAMVLMAGAAEAADPVQDVQGYTTRNGTYVSGYSRRTPPRVKWDSYSPGGNINPHKGKKSYKLPKIQRKR